MRKAKKPKFCNGITLGITLSKMAQTDCKTFIHRFDSDRRLHSHQLLTSHLSLRHSAPVAKNVTLFAKSGCFSSLPAVQFHTVGQCISPLDNLYEGIVKAKIAIKNVRESFCSCVDPSLGANRWRCLAWVIWRTPSKEAKVAIKNVRESFYSCVSQSPVANRWRCLARVIWRTLIKDQCAPNHPGLLLFGGRIDGGSIEKR